MAVGVIAAQAAGSRDGRVPLETSQCSYSAQAGGCAVYVLVPVQAAGDGTGGARPSR
jgi:hypothetical protein